MSVYVIDMEEAKMADEIDASDDPAKEFGSLEIWNGEKRYVLRNDKGHFVTWRKQGAAERDATANKAIADGGTRMYENLDFGGVQKAIRTSDDSGREDLDVEIQRETTASKAKLIIEGIGEGALIDVYLNLLSGDLEQDNARRSNPDYDFESVDVSVEDGEMEIVIDRVGELIELVIGCEGEIGDDALDLNEFGFDI